MYKIVEQSRTDPPTANHMAILNGAIITVHCGSSFGFGTTIVKTVE